MERCQRLGFGPAARGPARRQFGRGQLCRGLAKLPPRLAGKIGGLVAAKTPAAVRPSSGGAKAEALAALHKAEAIIRKMK